MIMTNLSNYDSNVISEVPISDTFQDNYVLDHCVQETYYSEHAVFVHTSVAKCNAVNLENKTVNESLTAELERYKEHIKKFEERKKVDLNDPEKYIDSQMREIIVNRNATFTAFENEIHTLKLRLSKNIEDNKTMTTTMDVLKKETKEKEDKYIEEIVDLEKQKKDLDNIVYK
ncbi:hypothetical protein Tco_0403473, partial [Tanacetum coccineum]